ncbi:MAG: TM2 domain-containing protein [Spirochaetia bacterium]|nr:TM2 domain-containing protein [Spirochaetia bacterium]
MTTFFLLPFLFATSERVAVSSKGYTTTILSFVFLIIVFALLLLGPLRKAFSFDVKEEKHIEKHIDKHIYTWIGSFFFGGLGIDRFMRGQVGLGILKLITFGGFGLWTLIDWIIAITKLGDYEKEFVFKNGFWSH